MKTRIFCFFGFHKFGKWSELKEFGYSYYQSRTCENCFITKWRESGFASKARSVTQGKEES